MSQHPLLRRQLRRIGADESRPPAPEVWAELLDRVSSTYVEADQDRYTLERSLSISSGEMQRLYEDLRRRSASELERSLAVTRASLEASLDGVLVVDQDKAVVTYNRRFAAMWALPADLLATRDDDRLLGHVLSGLAEPEEFLERVRYLYAHPSESSQDEIHLGDGRIFDRYSAPVLGPGGATFGRVLFFRDVTELRRAAKGLERQVAERTAQLLQSAKMAAIGTLVAGLSHELNNPIAVILGYVQSLLKRTAADAPAWPALDAIERQAQRCGHLVRALLDFSRGKAPERHSVGAEELLGRVEELARGQALGRAVRLVREAATELLPRVRACPEEIESALLNLVSNALDATPPGGAVCLRARAAERDGASGVELQVVDTGAGIPADVLPKIFDPFFTTKPVGQGTGLGLALTRQIMDAHEGRVEVDSGPDRGTTMRLWLPAAPGEARP